MRCRNFICAQCSKNSFIITIVKRISINKNKMQSYKKRANIRSIEICVGEHCNSQTLCLECLVITRIWHFRAPLGVKRGGSGPWLPTTLISFQANFAKMFLLLLETQSYMVLVSFETFLGHRIMVGATVMKYENLSDVCFYKKQLE